MDSHWQLLPQNSILIFSKSENILEVILYNFERNQNYNSHLEKPIREFQENFQLENRGDSAEM